MKETVHRVLVNEARNGGCHICMKSLTFSQVFAKKAGCQSMEKELKIWF